MEEAVSLLKLFVDPWVRRVGDVTKMAGDSHHVVSCLEEAQHVGSPRAAIIVTLGVLQSFDLLPSSLELGTIHVKFGLSSLEALRLLLEVGSVAGRAQI
jgi:hypothetical protein